MKKQKLSHIEEKGKYVMVDVSEKKYSLRKAKARGFISLGKETLALIEKEAIVKGNVLSIAELAAIMGAKKTSELIPLCHNLPLAKVKAEAVVLEKGIMLEAEAVCVGQTGVEMEVLCAVAIGLMTIYDMCKAVDKNMIIEKIELLRKTKEEVKA